MSTIQDKEMFLSHIVMIVGGHMTQHMDNFILKTLYPQDHHVLATMSTSNISGCPIVHAGTSLTRINIHAGSINVQGTTQNTSPANFDFYICLSDNQLPI